MTWSLSRVRSLTHASQNSMRRTRNHDVWPDQTLSLASSGVGASQTASPVFINGTISALQMFFTPVFFIIWQTWRHMTVSAFIGKVLMLTKPVGIA
jgi:hypothetical protein